MITTVFQHLFWFIAIFTRLLKDYTPFVVIAIQAYAEINQCKKAVEFAIRAFGDPQRFSPEVIELW